LEDKNRKIAENEQSARANLIVVMLKGLFYTQKGIPTKSGPVAMCRQNRRTLGIRDCMTSASRILACAIRTYINMVNLSKSQKGEPQLTIQKNTRG
jgi:hypothetical protein